MLQCSGCAWPRSILSTAASPTKHHFAVHAHELPHSAATRRPSQSLPAVRPRLPPRDLREDGELRRGCDQPRPRGFRRPRRQGAGPREHRRGDRRGRLGQQDAERADQRARQPLLVSRRGGPAGTGLRAARHHHDPEGRQCRRHLCRRRAGDVDRGGDGAGRRRSASRSSSKAPPASPMSRKSPPPARACRP
jgi:hypothetical protein